MQSEEKRFLITCFTKNQESFYVTAYKKTLDILKENLIQDWDNAMLITEDGGILFSHIIAYKIEETLRK